MKDWQVRVGFKMVSRLVPYDKEKHSGVDYEGMIGFMIDDVPHVYETISVEKIDGFPETDNEIEPKINNKID